MRKRWSYVPRPTYPWHTRKLAGAGSRPFSGHGQRQRSFLGDAEWCGQVGMGCGWQTGSAACIGESSAEGEASWGASTVVCIWLSGSEGGEEEEQKWTVEEKAGMTGLWVFQSLPGHWAWPAHLPWLPLQPRPPLIPPRRSRAQNRMRPRVLL